MTKQKLIAGDIETKEKISCGTLGIFSDSQDCAAIGKLTLSLEKPTTSFYSNSWVVYIGKTGMGVVYNKGGSGTSNISKQIIEPGKTVIVPPEVVHQLAPNPEGTFPFSLHVVTTPALDPNDLFKETAGEDLRGMARDN